MIYFKSNLQIDPWACINELNMLHFFPFRQNSQFGDEKTFSDSSLLENLQNNHVRSIVPLSFH